MSSTPKTEKAILDQLYGMPASAEVGKEVELAWAKILEFNRSRELESLTQEAGSLKRAQRLIRRAWAFYDPEQLRMLFSQEKPDDDLLPVEVIMGNSGSNWLVPTLLKIALECHPRIRLLSGKILGLPPRSRFERFRKWAEERTPSENVHDTMLSQYARSIDDLLYVEAFGDPVESGWIHSAKESDRFWIILETAINLGRRHALWGMLHDGTLEKAGRKRLLMEQKRGDIWRLKIEELLTEEHAKHGVAPTPAKLRKNLGAKVPHDLDSPLIFPEGVFKGLPPINCKRHSEKSAAVGLCSVRVCSGAGQASGA